MGKKLVSLIFFVSFLTGFVHGQSITRTTDLFPTPENNSHSGNLNIVQDNAIDTLLSRYILGNKKTGDRYGYIGMNGYRIQIYYSSDRNAREESSKVRARFVDKFPDIPSYALYQAPAWFVIRVGDFRSKIELYKSLVAVNKEFPNAYWVPDYINFPDLNIK
jgi:hypothetical protein